MGSVKRGSGLPSAPDRTKSSLPTPKQPPTKKIATDASVVLTEDTDQFMIGQRVWVGGSKPGVISFIGETQFAPGDWAGITLDEPIGKNDGSVGGVRYFQCESKKGVFSRLTRLSRVCLFPDEYDREQHDPSCARSSLSPARSVGSAGRSSITPTRRVSPPAATPLKSTPTPMAPPSGGSVARKVSNPIPAAPSLSSFGNLNIGDRVVVNSKTGVKVGVLRHLGRTEFADGLWAGVELDEPVGKNDGSVAGKKYFTCKPKYGLFSPMQCVSRLGPSSTPSRRVSAATPSKGVRRSNSRESLLSATSSVGTSSVSSNIARPSVRKPSLGAPGNTAARLAVSSHNKALQEALAEKTAHVDELLAEKETDRLELARLTAQWEKANRTVLQLTHQLSQSREGESTAVSSLREVIVTLQEDKAGLESQLEESKRQLDDLMFRLEEQTCTAADFEGQSASETAKVKELELKLGEMQRSLSQDPSQPASIDLGLLEKLSAVEKDNEDLQQQLAERIEDSRALKAEKEALVNDLLMQEQKLRLLEKLKDEDALVVSSAAAQFDGDAAQQSRIKELEEQLKIRIRELDEEVNKSIDLDVKVKELREQLKHMEEQRDLVNENEVELRSQKEICIELERKLQELVEEHTREKLQREEFETRCKELEICLEDARKDLQDSEKTVHSLTDVMKNLAEKEISLTDTEVKLKAREEEFTEYKKNSEIELQKERHEIEILSNRIKEISDDLNNKNMKIQQLNVLLEANSTSVHKFEDELTENKTVLEDKCKIIEKLTFELADKDVTIAGLEQSLQAKNVGFEEELSKQTVLLERVSALELEIANKSEEVELVKINMGTIDSECGELKMKIAEKESLESKLNGELEELRSSLEKEREKFNAELLEQMENDKAKVEEVQDLLSKIKVSEADLKCSLEEQSRNLEKRNRKYEESSLALLELESTLQQANKKISEVEATQIDEVNKREKAEKSLKEKSKELEEILETVKLLKSDLEAITREKSNSDGKIHALSVQLEEKTNELANNMKEIISLKAEVCDFAKKRDQNEKELLNLSEQLSSTALELQLVTSKHRDSEVALAKAQTELKNQSEELQQVLEKHKDELEKCQLLELEAKCCRQKEQQKLQQEHEQALSQREVIISKFTDQVQALKDAGTAKESELREALRLLDAERSRVTELEQLRLLLQQQVTAELSSSSSASEQLTKLNKAFEEKVSQLQEASESRRQLGLELQREKEATESTKQSWINEQKLRENLQLNLSETIKAFDKAKNECKSLTAELECEKNARQNIEQNLNDEKLLKESLENVKLGLQKELKEITISLALEKETREKYEKEALTERLEKDRERQTREKLEVERQAEQKRFEEEKVKYEEKIERAEAACLRIQADLQAELDKSKKDAEAQAETLQSAIGCLKKEIDDISTEKTEDSQALQKKLTDLGEEMKDLRSEKTKLVTMLNDAEKRIEIADADRLSFAAEHEKLITEKNQLLSATEKALASAVLSCEEKTKLCEAQDSLLAEKENSYLELMEKYNNISGQVTQLEILTMDHEKLKLELEAATNSGNNLQSLNDELQQRLDVHKENEQQLEMKFAELNLSLNDQKKLVSDADEKMKNLNSIIEKNSEKECRLQNELETTVQEKAEISAKLAQIHEKMSSVVSARDDVFDEIVDACYQLKTAEDEVQELMKDRDKLQSEFEAMGRKHEEELLSLKNKEDEHLKKVGALSKSLEEGLGCEKELRLQLESQLSVVVKEKQELAKSNEGLQTQISREQDTIEKLRVELSGSEKNCEILKSKYQELLQCKTKLENEHAHSSQEIESLKESLALMENSKSELVCKLTQTESEKSDIEMEAKTALEEKLMLSEVNKKIEIELQEVKNAEVELRTLLENAKTSVAGENLKLLSQKEELRSKLEALEICNSKLTEERDLALKQKSNVEGKLSAAVSEGLTLAEEKNALQRQIAELELTVSALQQSKLKLQEEADLRKCVRQELEKEVDELQSRLSEREQELELEKQNLVVEVVALEEQLQEARKSAILTLPNATVIDEDELQKLKSDLKRIRTERNQLKVDLQTAQYELAQTEDDRNALQDAKGEVLKSRVSSLEAERLRLQDRVSKLEDKLVSGCLVTSEAEAVFAAVRSERDQLTTQVEFLNSIIVDLNTKITELQASLAVALNPTDDDKAMQSTLARTKPPRLFCDICDCFDLHDTEDCPQQEGGDEEDQPHSHHGGQRGGPPRPYCTICEVFGHTEEECDDQQTF